MQLASFDHVIKWRHHGSEHAGIRVDHRNIGQDGLLHDFGQLIVAVPNFSKCLVDLGNNLGTVMGHNGTVDFLVVIFPGVHESIDLEPAQEIL